MKIHHFLLLITLASLIMTTCSDNNLLDSEVKNTCNWEDQSIMTLNNIETKLFYYDASKRPAELVLFDDGIVYHQKNGNAFFKIERNIEKAIFCHICNFPDDAKNLKVSDKGLDIVLSGKIYESTDFTYKYLELTKLKKK